MALKFKKMFAHKSNYGGERKTSDIKYIVIHYTGNQGDTAINNCKYFQGANRNASAHYFVDGGTYIYKSVPVTSVAWSVGGCYSLKNGAGTYYKKCTNANSISIEMCNSVKSVPAKVYSQTVELVKFLMEKYNVPASNVIRHWDVNGKLCPAPWTGSNNSNWKKFKEEISAKPKTFKEGTYNSNVQITEICPVRTGRGRTYKKIATLPVGRKVKALYIKKNSAGNLWASIDYGDSIGYICLNKAKPI